MELFRAASEEQLSFIKRVIDGCDYYLLIVAGDYGSTGADRISFREDYFHRRVEDERGAAVRVDDSVLVEYKFGARFHRPDILLRCFVFRCMLSLNVLTQGAAV